MENTRLRELTLFFPCYLSLKTYLVEMENTRLRELTQYVSDGLIKIKIRRNGEYPFKGIDTIYQRE